MLAEARWRDVRLDQLLLAEVEAFVTQRVQLNGPPVAIGAAQVQPLALVLHEAIANAVHHGALSTLAGTLSIRWTPASGWTQIEILESGGPAPASDRVLGFGMKIIDAIVHRQLRGNVAYDWHPGGLRSVFRLPQKDAS